MEVREVAVIGLSAMGAGIAGVFARAGPPDPAHTPTISPNDPPPALPAVTLIGCAADAAEAGAASGGAVP
jgi:3-hydroxyacyl-CoA dehydrogenase